MARSQRHQHDEQHLYTSEFFQQGVFCQCHRQHFPRKHKNIKREYKKKSRLRIPLSRLFLCRWWGSNPHVLLAQGILSPPRLPFRHTGVFYFTDNIVIIADFSPKIKMQLTTHQISANFLSPFWPRACILRETTSYPKEYSL